MSVIRIAQAAAALALGLAASAPSHAAVPDVHWSRNPHGFELGIQQTAAQEVSWQGAFTLRACRQPSCFQAKGALMVKTNDKGAWEATLPLAGACRLKIVNVAVNDMDSDDWQATPVSPGGCSGALAGVAGLYRSEQR